MGAPRRVAAAGRWLHRYRLSIWVVVFTAVTLYALVDARLALDRIERVAAERRAEALVDEADDCLDDWKNADGARAAIHASVTGIVTLAFNVSGPNLSEERRQQIAAAADPVIELAQRQIADPDCDRERARERLEEGAP